MEVSGKAYRRYRRVADLISDRIAGGHYTPGTRLPAERDLAAEFGVSRATVREAMIALELMGRVVPRGGSGVYVQGAEPSRTEIDAGPGTFEILEARRIIEADVARIAAAAIDRRTLRAMRDYVEEMIAAVEAGTFSNLADQKFHVAIARATGNGVLLAVVEQLWKFRLESNMWVILEERTNTRLLRSGAVESHINILKALESGEPDLAHAAMDRHMRETIDFMLTPDIEAPSVSEPDRRSKLRLLLDR